MTAPDTGEQYGEVFGAFVIERATGDVDIYHWDDVDMMCEGVGL